MHCECFWCISCSAKCWAKLYQGLLKPVLPPVQIENTMFINKMKEQLLPTEKGCSLAPPHYPALLTVPTSVALPAGIAMDSDTKPEQLTPHSQAPVTQNITVVPVQSAGLMTAGRARRRLWQCAQGTLGSANTRS